MVTEFASEAGRLRHFEIAGLIERGAGLDDERFTGLEIPRLDVLDINPIMLGIDLPDAPARAKHRSDVTRAAQDVLERHERISRGTLGRVVCARYGASSGPLKIEQGLRKHSLFRSVVLIPLHEADGRIEKDVGTF